METNPKAWARLSDQEPRQLALAALIETIIQRRSANQLLEGFVLADRQQQAFARMLYLETLRFYPRLCRLADKLLKKPLKSRDLDIYLVIILGISQLKQLAVADHAAISETVNLCRLLEKDWACRLVNGVLRNLQRNRGALESELAQDPVFATAHPAWMVKKIRKAWPSQADDIFSNNNLHPPLSLRVNLRRIDREDFISRLKEAGSEFQPHPFAGCGVIAQQSENISELPGFNEGHFVVQDCAAQLAADFLQPQEGEWILDACAAPGGKTTHILQNAPQAKVTALDISEQRLAKVRQNLNRLQQTANLVAADLLATDQWWNQQLFDRILLDAPCSATGVIRRNPDIKVHRRERDINKLARLQAAMLDCCWSLLKPGGRLVYATCSVMPAENHQQIDQFLTQNDARLLPVPEHLTQLQKHMGPGLQILPGEAGMDGFYLCALEKPVMES